MDGAGTGEDSLVGRVQRLSVRGTGGKLKYVNFSVFNLDHFKLFSSNNRGVIINTGGFQEVYFFLMLSFYCIFIAFEKNV